MLGRGSDAAGKANWVSKLDAGQPFAVVINGFCVSKEFTGICASYGIKPGNVNIRLSAQSEEELSMLALNAKAPITRRSETKPNRVEIINPSDTIDMNIGTAVQAVYINEEKASFDKEPSFYCGKEITAPLFGINDTRCFVVTEEVKNALIKNKISNIYFEESFLCTKEEYKVWKKSQKTNQKDTNRRDEFD